MRPSKSLLRIAADEPSAPAPSRPAHPFGHHAEIGQLEYACPDDGFENALFEVWTMNTIYYVDVRFVCVGAVSRRGAAPSRRVLGWRLGGGERRSPGGELLALYQPLPVPGSCAVFENAAICGRIPTSCVERLVVRLRKAVPQARFDADATGSARRTSLRT